MPTCENCDNPISVYDEICSICGAANPAHTDIPDDIAVKMSNADGLLQTGNYRASAKFYHEIVSQDRRIFDAYANLAHCYTRLQLWIQAYTMMKHAANLRPGDSTIRYNMGVIAAHAGQPTEAARTHLEDALRLAETDPRLHNPASFIKRVEKALKQV